MNKVAKYLSVLFFFVLFFIPFFTSAESLNNKINTCAVYFTGVGCPHCAQADPVVLKEALKDYPDLVVIEYEVYQTRGNPKLMTEYDDQYGAGLGIPLLIFDENNFLRGDKDIENDLEETIKTQDKKCPLPDGSLKNFSDLDLSKLPQYPKIWKGNRVLIKEEGGASADLLRKLMESKNFSEFIESRDYVTINDKSVDLSGSKVEFENAVKLEGWVIKWNGEDVEYVYNDQADQQSKKPVTANQFNTEFTWFKITSLALVDAVNPCAFAVLILMLTAILSYNPRNRKNIILAGLAFVGAVFVMYLFYGLILIKFMQVIQALTSIKLWMYKILGVIAIILGILNIKDFISYKPGSLGTEMPLTMRPKVKKIISGITSPAGAIVVGAFVTLFLLPCTIGPYIICCGVLSVKNITQSLPPLLWYNLLFVTPMLVIIAIVYLGLRQVQDISAWKEKNIHKLHLVAGLIMFGLGLAMLLGWV